MTLSEYDCYRDWKEWGRKPFGSYTREHALYFAEEIRRSGAGDINGKSILEIGFGNGEFAAWARDSGADYFGTELLDDLVAKGAAAGFRMHSGQVPIETLRGEQAADVIVAFDVFEHFDAESLEAALRSARQTLRPAGRLIARLPSGDSPFSRAIQHGDATHRVIVGSSMIHQLAHQTGFTVARVSEPAFPLRGLGPRAFVRRACVAGFRAVTFGIMTRAFMGGGRPVLTPNMVCVLVRP